jgi:2-C-methyl-D-erythritol 4-phosphate cytidylyltransferase / 2-C-methyl-D-erythritol 2,4-cyclodiphosphate synthase
VLISFGCDPVIVVVPPEHVALARSLCTGLARTVVTAGGATRRASVTAGLELVATENVVVHDAARPFLQPRWVELVSSALEDADGAIVAVPVDDTLKRVAGGRVVATVDRTDLWTAQTPQAFRVDALRAAHRAAVDEGLEATDDAQLVETYGGRVVVIEGERTNLKLTYPEDFALAESIMRSTR